MSQRNLRKTEDISRDFVEYIFRAKLSENPYGRTEYSIVFDGNTSVISSWDFRKQMAEARWALAVNKEPTVVEAEGVRPL